MTKKKFMTLMMLIALVAVTLTACGGWGKKKRRTC